MLTEKIPTPCATEVEKYLERWNTLESYVLQESSLEKLFVKAFPKNTDADEVLAKVAVLNDFYSTNIFKTYNVAMHIICLDIDERLEQGDETLVNDIAVVDVGNGKTMNFYSFATKYCSHHKPKDYPIYDSYIDEVLRYARKEDGFYKFRNNDLKDYITFKNILLEFQKFYGLENFDLKEIDKYLWQLGKEFFSKKYYK